MPPSPAVRRLFLAVAMLILLGLAWTGLHNGLSLLAPAQSTGQKVQAFTQMTFGLFGLLGVVTTFWGRWRPFVLTCFAITLSIASGLFVVVWSRSSVFMGIVTGALALFIAWAIIGLLRKGLAV